MRQAPDLDIRWFEEPVASDDLDGVLDPAGCALHLDPVSPGNALTFRSADVEQFRVH